MKTTSFIAALLASTALAACGGGEEAAETTDSADAGMQSGATETSGEAMAEDAAEDAEASMEDAGEAAEDMADDASDAMGDMAEDAEAAAEDAMSGAEEAASDAADSMDEMAGGEGDDGQFMVAGLAGDAEQGRRVFARCRSCHVLEEGVNRVGPSLYGIFGRETGSVDGFRYSEANANADITWTAETMFEYLENPREYIPGTIMAFPGLRDEQDRADVIAYMKANGGMGDAG